jgi:protein-S-isoprenylcysteine O-methyltransferase Ste14
VRLSSLFFGIVAYLIFFIAFLYLIGFVGNFALPTTIDRGGTSAPLQAIGIDLALLLLFAVQHSVMARQSFKRWWTGFIPASLERSTYVLLSSFALVLLFWQWRPIQSEIWTVTNPLMAGAISALYWTGWIVALLSTFLISHFELFGLSQVLALSRNRKLPALAFKTPFFYKYVRHPLYLGFLLAFWAAPAMTAGHLLFALAMTGYILFAVQLEERDLIETFGDKYRSYRQRVGMLVPVPGRNLAARGKESIAKIQQ